MKPAGPFRLPSLAPFGFAQDLRQGRRWLFNFAAIVSPAICVVIGFMWLRSYGTTTTLRWSHGARDEWAIVVRGHVILEHVKGIAAPARPGLKHTESPPMNVESVVLAPTDWQRSGLGHKIIHFQYPDASAAGYIWLFPLWQGFVATLLPPLILLGRNLRAQHPPGTCSVCGYDLRATPDRCPECGEIPQSARGAAT